MWYWVIVTVVVLGFVALRAMVSNRSGGWWVVLRWLLNGILLFIGLFALLLLVMARNLGEF